MVRVPCCEKLEVKKGPWTPEEDHKLVTYIQNHGHSSWRALPRHAGLARCGKSCRLRWTNYLRPGIKRGNFSPQEENAIIQLHAVLGNRWSTISTHLPGRTDNEIKNHWNTRLRKRMLKMGIDPMTHRPWVLPQQVQQQPPLAFHPSYINTLLLSVLQGAPSAADAQSSPLNALLLGSKSFAPTPAAPGHAFQHSPPRAPAAPGHVLPPPAMLDPSLLAAAETRLVLDCLKFNTSENQASNSDHQLNQLLTRLLLIKFLQSSNNHAPPPSSSAAGFENRAPMHNITQRNGPIPAEHLLQTQGLHPAGTILMPPANNREAAAAPAAPSAYLNPNLCASSSDNGQSNTPNTMLLNMFNSSYQQRLLQTLPFLAESMMEPCTSAAATDHLSSTSPQRLSQARFPNCPGVPAELPSQPWLGQGGADNQMLPSGGQAAQLLGLMQKQALPEVMPSGAQLFGGMHEVAATKVPTLVTWEEHLMSEQKGGDMDLASSSTVSSSTLSSGSQSHAAPNTPTNNFNIQEYWSNLLNLISPTK